MTTPPGRNDADGRGTQAQYEKAGWCAFPHDPVLADWLTATLPAARAAIAAPENQQWLRYQGTWFAGVNALPNDATGAVRGGPPLAGRAVDFIGNVLGITGFPGTGRKCRSAIPAIRNRWTAKARLCSGFAATVTPPMSTAC